MNKEILAQPSPASGVVFSYGYDSNLYHIRCWLELETPNGPKFQDCQKCSKNVPRFEMSDRNSKVSGRNSTVSNRPKFKDFRNSQNSESSPIFPLLGLYFAGEILAKPSPRWGWYFLYWVGSNLYLICCWLRPDPPNSLVFQTKFVCTGNCEVTQAYWKHTFSHSNEKLKKHGEIIHLRTWF